MFLPVTGRISPLEMSASTQVQQLVDALVENPVTQREEQLLNCLVTYISTSAPAQIDTLFATANVTDLITRARNDQQARDLILRHPLPENLLPFFDLYAQYPIIMERIATALITRAMDRGVTDQDFYNIMGLFIRNPTHAKTLAQRLSLRAPISLAYRLDRELHTDLFGVVSIDFLYHLVTREGMPLSVTAIDRILGYPPTSTREKTYYAALSTYIRPLTNINTELQFLRAYTRTRIYANLIERRERILELFPTEDITFENNGCLNDSGFIAGIDEVPPILLYKDETSVVEGDVRQAHCFPSSEVFSMLDLNTTRHPYTGSDFTQEEKQLMILFLRQRLERNYPVMFSTAQDFYGPLPVPADMFNRERRWQQMYTRLRLYAYVDSHLAKLMVDTGLQALAFVNLRPLIVQYYRNYNWSEAISTSYPNVERLINQLARGLTI